MSIQVAIKHQTKYKYDRFVNMSPQIIRLRAAPHTRTPVLAYSLKIAPENHFINWQQDPFGNYLARVVFPKPINEFVVDVELVAEMKVINPFDFFLEDYAEKFPFTYPQHLEQELSPYLKITDNSPTLENWVKHLQPFYGSNTVDFLVQVNQKLFNEVNYTIRLEPGVQTPEDTLLQALGSCRDSAWVLVQAFRSIGLAARFVSGYLIQLKPDKKSVDGPSGPEEDFTDLHAWCEVYIPGAGWIGLDATSGLFAGEGHIPLCCTPEPSSASPITGMTDPAEVEFSYTNRVFRIHEDPRVTQPYSEQQWEKINHLAYSVDEALENGKVHLTMGGEPTFVSNSDMESDQWNSDADGEDKRKKAFQFAQNLNHEFANSKALVHIGQGKWYPGEAVPRWQYGLYWRKDGIDILSDPNHFGNPSDDYGYTFKQAEGLLKEIANRLKLPVFNIEPAYEDVYYYLWQENQLPVNIDPNRIHLSDTLERKTLSEVLQKKLNNPVGFALPLEWNFDTLSWLSCAWEFRQKHLYLIPGNSPMGLRLPLNSLPHMVAAQRNHEVERSPFEDVGTLPDYLVQIQQQQSPSKNLDSIPPDRLYPKVQAQNVEEQQGENNYIQKKKKKKDEDFEPEFRSFTIKTALSVEARQGKLFVFFPPFAHIEQYLELLAHVEAAAKRLSLKIIIEGYEPPRDNRIEKLLVTPDPGVIEVNIHPAKNWTEIKKNYKILFQSAEKCGLGTEKFMLDGRHIGSGGGHHITLGGTTPAESPLLRRPDVLKSFILFWQNHPGLSYLFSTAFIGSTSQAPRVDEVSQDHLYNLEIALNQIHEGEETPFWKTDRILRNLLVDITGNTHRSEFCIDKLYSPDSSSGRLGILELRAFEMPPDERMCLVQLLLVRTLMAWFWKKPYRGKLIRWGTELHDKFMLHHFVKEDLSDVCEQLQNDGYPFDINWLEPFFEFRFPLVGRIQRKGITLSIRNGIEPWQVLGEEMSRSGTTRFVDSSIERIEVKVEGINEARYAILCNEQRIALRSTGAQETFVAGIRYKAWAPPSSMHPTLPIDVPLTFDIYDIVNQKSIGGCNYFVSHPGGRNYDTYPINAYEAEARRESRFFNFGHTQGDVSTSVATQTQNVGRGVRYLENDYVSNIQNVPQYHPDADKEFPYTLDLRKRR